MTRWAILGTGDVARKFASGLRLPGAQASIVRVASRSQAKALRFAADFGIPAAQDYAEAVTCAEADAVYIALPPSEHETHALAAIASGKAVLIEKPFAMNEASARRIAAAATAAGVFCMEAMWTRFLPLIRGLHDRAGFERGGQGAIGDLRAFHGSFRIANAPDAQSSLFDPARGGGALMHRGVYAMSLARHFLGPIADVTGRGRIGRTGVDEDCTVILRHESGALSTIMASLCAGGVNDMVLSGTRGTLHIAAPIYRPFQATLRPETPRTHPPRPGRFAALRESGAAQRVNQMMPDALSRLLGGSRTIRLPYAGNGYQYQAAETGLCIGRGETGSPIMPLDESIEIMAAIDAARAQFGGRDT